jgi:hypothetical protein
MVCTLVGCGCYVYIVDCGVLQIPDIFCTAGFMLICDLVVSEKLRICVIKIINVVFVLVVITFMYLHVYHRLPILFLYDKHVNKLKLILTFSLVYTVIL